MHRVATPGKLIAVEGMDGSGKSTQIRLLYEYLKAKHLKVFFTEWNSSQLIAGATKRGKQTGKLTPSTFSLIHAADFFDRYERQILPMLEAGYIVLCDRYLYTALARDGVRGCDRDWILNLYNGIATPDITFYYQVPKDIALGRILRGRPELKFYEAGMDLGLADTVEESFRIFQSAIKDQYDGMADEFGLTILDGTKEIHDLQKETRKLVKSSIDLDAFKYKGDRVPWGWSE